MGTCGRHGVFALVLLLIGMLIPLQAVAAETTVLRILTNGSDEYLENTRIFFRAFEERNPGIQVEIEVGGLDKFLVMYAAGQSPDLLRLYGQFVPEYAARGLIQSLEPFIGRSQVVSTEDLVPAAIGSLSYNGELFSIPWGLAVTSWFFNADHYDEAGLSIPDASWTWEVEAIDAGRKLTRDLDGDGQVDRYFLSFGGTTTSYAFANMAGGELFDNHTWEYVADSPESIEGLAFQFDLIHQYRVMPGPSTVSNVGDWNLIRGTASTTLEGSWYVSSLVLTDVPFQWDIGLVPSFRGGRGTSIWPETPWAIPSGVANPELSWQLMEFIGSPEGQILATQLGLAMPPIRLDVAREVMLREYPNRNVANITEMALAPLSRAIPTAPGPARSALDSAIASIMAGQAPARQALEAARPQAEAAVREFLATLGE